MKNEKEEYVFRVFQSIAEGYDSANRRISLGAHLRWKKSAVKSMMASLPEGAALLDIGCGTGDMLRIFSELCPAAALTGLDFSPNMLKAAEANLRDVPNLTLQQGNALDLPFPDASFDGVSISFALRNTADYLRALQEAFRVLKAGGMLLVIDSFVPESPVVRPKEEGIPLADEKHEGIHQRIRAAGARPQGRLRKRGHEGISVRGVQLCTRKKEG